MATSFPALSAEQAKCILRRTSRNWMRIGQDKVINFIWLKDLKEYNARTVWAKYSYGKYLGLHIGWLSGLGDRLGEGASLSLPLWTVW